MKKRRTLLKKVISDSKQTLEMAQQMGIENRLLWAEIHRLQKLIVAQNGQIDECKLSAGEAVYSSVVAKKKASEAITFSIQALDKSDATKDNCEVNNKLIGDLVQSDETLTKLTKLSLAEIRELRQAQFDASREKKKIGWLRTLVSQITAK